MVNFVQKVSFCKSLWKPKIFLETHTAKISFSEKWFNCNILLHTYCPIICEYSLQKAPKTVMPFKKYTHFCNSHWAQTDYQGLSMTSLNTAKRGIAIRDLHVYATDISFSFGELTRLTNLQLYFSWQSVRCTRQSDKLLPQIR